MAKDNAKMPAGIRNPERRDLLKRIAVAGAAASVPTSGLIGAESARAAAQQLRVTQPLREALEALTAAEADTLEAIVARLIPSDDLGPGAAEARAAHYIDRALAGALVASRRAYVAGLAALDAYSQASRGAPFVKLTAGDQDRMLSEVQNNKAQGFRPNSAAFFNMVRTHTIQGTFCDPYYGGNANYVGWDLIGYPGIRLVVTPDDQRMSAAAKPVRRSAYDEAMFSKRGGGHGH